MLVGDSGSETVTLGAQGAEVETSSTALEERTGGAVAEPVEGTTMMWESCGWVSGVCVCGGNGKGAYLRLGNRHRHRGEDGGSHTGSGLIGGAERVMSAGCRWTCCRRERASSSTRKVVHGMRLRELTYLVSLAAAIASATWPTIAKKVAVFIVATIEELGK